MPSRNCCLIIFCAVLMLALSIPFAAAQTSNASIDGEVRDQNGAAVQNATVKLVNKGTGALATFVTGPDGLYSFPNVVPENYKLTVSAPGFKEYVQDGILVRLGYPIRQNVALSIGAVTEEVVVKADASALNLENAEVRTSIDPEVIKDVPLLVAGSIRSVGNFASILPGVTRGAGDVTGAHVNGSQSQTGVVILDGISLFNSSGIQGLTGAVLDFPQSPDVISEFQVLTSNYSPKYGGSAAGVTVENVRSGTNSFHGTAYEFNRNTAMNATQFGATSRGEDIENDFGGNIGGPVKIPGLWGDNHKTFFFANFEAFKIVGGLLRQTLSLPTPQERQGDFSDWTDSNGNLIPIYDPATTTTNPAFNPSQPVGPSNLPYLRQQFMGCGGTTPNVICSTDPRLQNSLAAQWFKFLPAPTSSGTLNNYLAPPTPNFLGTNAYTVMEKVDENIGSRDHFSEMFFYKYLPETTFTTLPVQISNSGTSYKRTTVVRINYDHTFSPEIINHFGFGYQNDKYFGGGIDGKYAAQLPQIPGVASHTYPPQVIFGGGQFTGYGTGQGDPHIQPWLAPAYIANDVVSLTRGKHLLSLGADLRLASDNPLFLTNQSGQFTFNATETGLTGLNSGSPIASFLLEQVDHAAVTYYSTNTIDARTHSFAIFAGDTWRATPKLTLDGGLRYEIDPPTVDAHNHFSYFDPTLANPGAGNLPGAIAFAGSGPGRSGLRHPEDTWYGAIAPRLGLAYAVRPDTVIRSGYGIFYDAAYMPGFDGGITQDGYNTYANFGSSLGGLQPAFVLNQGIPSTYPVPPQLVSTIDNGSYSAIYRPKNANRLPYAQQWNLTIEHEFTARDYISAAYVGNKGTRLLSQIDPINVLNPSYLSMGSQLNDVFQSGQTVLDGVNAPFPNFADTMVGCAASVAQALLPYPQYCNALLARNENQGNSTYHSFQFKAEHRLSKGAYALVTYTNSKLITTSDANENGGEQGVVNPYQKNRIRALALEDVPQAINVLYSYQLPFGRGKQWLNNTGMADWILGGWELNGVFRAQSGIPFVITSSSCNVPAQFSAQCLPGLLPGAKPFTGSLNGRNLLSGLPYLNAASFEPVTDFNFYTGFGPRVQSFRQPGYRDFDLGLQQIFHITERIKFQLRGDAFNIFNAHYFNTVGVSNTNGYSSGTGGSAFTTDIAAGSSFGTWNGTVTAPRNIQVSGRFSF
jgi:hypothetical protein